MSKSEHSHIIRESHSRGALLGSKVIGPLRRVVAVKKHLAGHVGQQGTPGGGSQPGFTHEGGSGGGKALQVGGETITVPASINGQSLATEIKKAHGSAENNPTQASWIAPDGERLAENVDHQSSAIQAIGEIDPSIPVDDFSATIITIESGMVRHTDFESDHGFSMPNNLTLDQRESVVSMMIQLKGKNPRSTFTFDRVKGGILESYFGNEVAKILRLDRDFWDFDDDRFVVRHLGGHVGQQGTPEGGSQPGFEHVGVAEGGGDGEDHFVDEIYSVSANFFGTEEDILVKLIEWDPDAEEWTIEIISGPSRESVEEIGSFDLDDPDEADLVIWTETGGGALEDRATSIFGLTSDFNEAGFILSSGDMLDFSGKREGGLAGTRALDHRDVGRAFIDGDFENLPEERSASDGLIYFMNETGAVRISYFEDSVAVDLASAPTRAQRQVVESFGFLAGGIDLDISSETGGILWQGRIDDPEDVGSEINRLSFEFLRNRAFITMVFRHLGGHVGQEGTPGGGSQPGFTHVGGSVEINGGTGEWNPEDDNAIEFGRKLSLDEDVDETRGVRFKDAAKEALRIFYEKTGIKPRGLTVTNSYLELADAIIEGQRHPGLNRFELAGYLADRSSGRSVVGSYENDTLWLTDRSEGDLSIGGESWNSTIYHELGHWVHNDVLDGFQQGEIVLEIEGSQRYIDEAKTHYGDDTARLRREYVADIISAVVSAPSGQTPAFHRWDLGTFNETENADLTTLSRIIDRAIEKSPEISRTLDEYYEDKRFLVVLPKGAGEMLVVTTEEAHRDDWPKGTEIIDLANGLPLEVSAAASSLMGVLRTLKTEDLRTFIKDRWGDFVYHIRSM